MVNATSYVNPTETYAQNVSGGGTLTAYMLVNTVYDLQNMENNLSGTYALGRDIDAGVMAGWNPNGDGTYAGFAPVGNGGSGTTATQFTGLLNGQTFTVSGSTIDDSYGEGVGLFGLVAAGVRCRPFQGVSRPYLIANPQSPPPQ